MVMADRAPPLFYEPIFLASVSFDVLAYELCIKDELFNCQRTKKDKLLPLQKTYEICSL